MKLPDSFLEELRARTPLPALIGRRVKLNRSGRNWKACCPFHGEKSPSFYAYDDHYHCFGCGAHGDAIGFVMQSQGASFMEAVESLAAEAGLDLPKPSREAEEAERQRLDLHEILQKAAAFYQAQLYAPTGVTALAYLRKRGLTDETISRFGLGWSGDRRGALERHFAADEVGPARLMEAGLLRPGEDGTARGDFFFNRVIFPIRDRRGRVISFGGRALGDGQPKYLNGPETPLFSKRRTLYGLDLARAAPRGAPIIAVEGYMDVIALHQAGFPGAIAPLGTALTEEQLEELWRLSPAPTLCFDGDAAGARAAERAINVCLPFLSPDRTINVATLHDGYDPDTYLRKNGAKDFQAIIKAARPVSDVLYSSTRQPFPKKLTIEQRAKLLAVLRSTIAVIPDAGLRAAYTATFRQFCGEEPWPRKTDAPTAAKTYASTPRPDCGPDRAADERCMILLAIAVAFPVLIDQVEEPLLTLALPNNLATLREELFTWAETATALDFASLTAHLTRLGKQPDLDLVLAALPAATTAERALSHWWNHYALHNRAELDRQVAVARQHFTEKPTDEAFRRLNALTHAQLLLKGGGVGWDDGASDEVLQG